MRVLVTGATGYIGGRLVPRLLRAGHTVRMLVRDPNRIVGRPWMGPVDVWRGDLLKPETLPGAFDGVEAAYYLVHSMCTGKEFAQRDRRAAENFCQAATELQHVIYLGGLQPTATSKLSRHLQSRAEIGRLLARHLPTTELRSGPIIGSGSASFEMIRYLVERLPVMIAPNWVLSQVQPIAIRDVLSYLAAALDRGPSGVAEIGSDQLTYKQMMEIYAQERGLRRAIVCVPPLLPAWLGARAIGLLTPITNDLAVPLVESMTQSLVVTDNRAREWFPDVEPIPYQKAVRLALARIQAQAVETRWSGALATDEPTYEYHNVRGMVCEVRSLHVAASPDACFRVFSGLGGERGWLTWNWAWWMRGTLDQLIGGPGLRRGRRDPEQLLPGEVLDFWRVEALERPRLLRLRAEVKLPGHGWLHWEAIPERGGTRLTQVAAFVPHGLPGAVYWYMLYPFHRLIFTDMIKAIGRQAMQSDI